jgi:hypothetical protein
MNITIKGDSFLSTGVYSVQLIDYVTNESLGTIVFHGPESFQIEIASSASDYGQIGWKIDDGPWVKSSFIKEGDEINIF